MNCSYCKGDIGLFDEPWNLETPDEEVTFCGPDCLGAWLGYRAFLLHAPRRPKRNWEDAL